MTNKHKVKVIDIIEPWPKEPLEVTDRSQIFKIALMFLSMIGASLFAVRVLVLQHEIIDLLKQILAK